MSTVHERDGDGAVDAAGVAVLDVPLSGVRDRRHGAAPGTRAAARVVLGGLPGRDRDAGDLRVAAAASARAVSVRDGVDDVAEAAPGDGQPEREPLTGAIEVGEGFLGGHAEGLRGGRQHGGKALVVIAVEARGAGCGRVRMKLIGDASAGTLCGFVTAIARPGTTVHTDGWQGCKRLSRPGYDHQPRSQQRHRTLGGDPDEILPRVHRVISNLKTWLHGTHHGVSPEHLPVYLDEFVFRFNRRRTPMAAFQALLGPGSQQQPTTYHQITALGSRTRKHLAEPTG